MDDYVVGCPLSRFPQPAPQHCPEQLPADPYVNDYEKPAGYLHDSEYKRRERREVEGEVQYNYCNTKLY